LSKTPVRLGFDLLLDVASVASRAFSKEAERSRDTNKKAAVPATGTSG